VLLLTALLLAKPLDFRDGGRPRRVESGRLVELDTGRSIAAELGGGVVLRQLRPDAALPAKARPLMPAAGLYFLAGDPTLLIDALRDRDDLEATPDLLLPVRRAGAPDDPRYGGQWYLETVAIEAAWAVTEGSPDVEILVVDNGCDLSHPDLAANMGPGIDVVDADDDPAYLPAPPCDEDADCCPGGPLLGPCCNDRGLCNTGNNHGTACAGIVGAESNNGTGIAGLCPRCTLRCARFLSDAPQPLSAAIAVFNYALEQGVAVVSNSWGYVSPVAAPAALAAAIETVISQGRDGLGSVVVFAAGNDARELADDELTGLPGVVTVGAITVFEELTSFSNSGSSIDLVAPGGTLSTDISGPDGSDGGDYTGDFGGTSAACPVVAGVMGLLASRFPAERGAQWVQRVMSTLRPAPYAVPDAAGHDRSYGFGIVAPAAALAPPPAVPEVPRAAGDECCTALRPLWLPLLLATAIRRRTIMRA
jgi:subtilisin family serine protease